MALYKLGAGWLQAVSRKTADAREGGQLMRTTGERLTDLLKGCEGKTLTLLIGKYRVGSDSPTGRATKGYIAYVVGLRRLLFLKTSWRPVSANVTPEAERYRNLYAHDVPYIAKLISAADTQNNRKSKTFYDQPLDTNEKCT